MFKAVTHLLIGFVALHLSTSAVGAVYKCVGADGQVSYQQSPCPAGEEESVPKLTSAPTVSEAERLKLQADAEDSARRDASAASGRSLLADQRRESDERRRREYDCNKRHDQLAQDARKKFTSPQAAGNLQKNLTRIEEARTSCLYGASFGSNNTDDSRNSRRGQCQGQCASEQGICMGACQGNGACVSNCAAAHGRCVGSC